VWRYRKSAEGSWSHHSLPHAAILPKVEGSSKSHWIVENTDMILWYWYERVLLWFKVRSILRSNLCKAKKNAFISLRDYQWCVWSLELHMAPARMAKV
jgi:hypothetical protein